MRLNALTIDMRELWKRVRLDAIRSAVEVVIGQLEADHTHSKPDDAESALGRTVCPDRAALQVCCDELRTGCGLTPLHPPAEPGPLHPPADNDWEARHVAALERYRNRARTALREALGHVPEDPL